DIFFLDVHLYLHIEIRKDLRSKLQSQTGGLVIDNWKATSRVGRAGSRLSCLDTKWIRLGCLYWYALTNTCGGFFTGESMHLGGSNEFGVVLTSKCAEC